MVRTGALASARRRPASTAQRWFDAACLSVAAAAMSAMACKRAADARGVGRNSWVMLLLKPAAASFAVHVELTQGVVGCEVRPRCRPHQHMHTRLGVPSQHDTCVQFGGASASLATVPTPACCLHLPARRLFSGSKKEAEATSAAAHVPHQPHKETVSTLKPTLRTCVSG